MKIQIGDQSLVSLALRELRGEVLSDDENKRLALDLEEWRRVLMLEVVQVRERATKARESIKGLPFGGVSSETRRKIHEQDKDAKDLAAKVLQKLSFIKDRIRQRNIALSNTKERTERRFLFHFLRETQAIVPFEDPFLDWHVRCSALLESLGFVEKAGES